MRENKLFELVSEIAYSLYNQYPGYQNLFPMLFNEKPKREWNKVALTEGERAIAKKVR